MIKIRVLSGPHKGKERTPTMDIVPLELLGEFAMHGWRWEVDFDQATNTEITSWATADMSARIGAALQHGRWVRFQGVEYRAHDQSDMLEVAKTLEDAIVTSGCMVMVELDDSKGLIIGAAVVN